MKSHLPEWYLNNKTVFLRADLNVPLHNGTITSDFRLQALQPTLNMLVQKKARIILGTHIGRPTGYDERLSTIHLLPWFKEHNYTIVFAPTLEEAQKNLTKILPGTLLLLENLRFFKEEKEPTILLAQNLATFGTYYVNDAFALLHRSDTSITLLPSLYDQSHKTIGLLIEKELALFHHLKTNPQRPFLVFLGGGKVKDKLPLIEALLSFIDSIALCPAIVFTFLKAQGIPVGKSLVENSLLGKARSIIQQAHTMGIKLLYPIDYQVSKESLDGPLEYVTTLEENNIGLSVGPQTLALFAQEVQKAGTIFLNGAMGLEERPETQESLHILLRTIAQSQALSVIGGGESVAAVYHYGLIQDISFCSTGGGALLAYLSHKKLPGLLAME